MQRIGVTLFRIIQGSMDTKSTAYALAKQLKYQCEGVGDVTLSKDTLRIVLDGFIKDWDVTQVKIRQGFEKVK